MAKIVYITESNLKKIIRSSNIQTLKLQGEIYKIPIYFFSKYEENELLAIQELLKDPESYFTEIYIPFEAKDTYTYVYEGKQPSYHMDSNCSRMKSDYENFAIPEKIKEQGEETVREFRRWFEDVKHLLKQPDLFVLRLQTRWNIVTNPNAIRRPNSGIAEKENLTVEELDKRINTKIKEAGRFYYQTDKNKKILSRFSKATFLADKKYSIPNNDTEYSETDIKELLNYYDKEFKRPLKNMLIEYYRLKLNPDLKIEAEILELNGFKPCGSCGGLSYAKQDTISVKSYSNDDLPF